ncbi:hypothetical protein LCGC14_0113130 [marine sediment metagenome]|uniref:MYG1 family protein n=2 Tax=root TaxID=1 RepID=A0A7V1BDT4_9RHOB|nr:MYG1 family protein [Sulfitobacter litoralis]HDZ51419.1 MYG1 family protein [Sulfitobacter litoralis]
MTVTDSTPRDLSQIKYLVTHSGWFHADDVCAAAVLQTILPEAGVVRTRDASLLRAYEDQAITFDVGGRCDPAAGYFDHHMSGAREREDGTIYSSFGLIWQAYGREYLTSQGVDEDFIEDMFTAFDADVVLPIDKIDTGSLSPAQIGETAAISLPAVVDAFNAADPDQANAQFTKIVNMTMKMLEAKTMQYLEIAKDHQMVADAVAVRGGAQVLELPKSADFQPSLDKLGTDHVLYVIQPSSSGGFGLSCARPHAGTYENLRDLPAEWGGLTGADLEELTGVTGATFCHTALFFAACDTLEAARELAQLALPGDPEPSM